MPVSDPNKTANTPPARTRQRRIGAEVSLATSFTDSGSFLSQDPDCNLAACAAVQLKDFVWR
ncbi:hypothetical protein JOH49_009536 [Bradyrhizobium elkanii]|uniref:Uncharacterized protein n=1 Tax=Bradyrhizobium elkanii TaxID=29448 RepID=A0A8I2C9Q0_BRAEL|nr:hypothetical protein [Bradyrhizobium elkanii]